MTGGARRRRGLGVLLGLLVLASPAGAELSVQRQTLRYEEGGRVVWQRTFPAALGDLTGPVMLGDNSYVGVGPVVYAFSDQGKVLGRADLPGQVSALDNSGRAIRVTVRTGGSTERFTLSDPADGPLAAQERVVMPPDPQVTRWLSRFSASLPASDLPAAAEQFPQNPFIALRLAQQAGRHGDEYEALSAVRRALGSTLPFPAWTELAAQLDSAGFPAAANLALDRAKRDAASRGVDPAIPVSRAALSAYGNPSGYVGTLLDQNRLARADVWMNFLRELYPRFEGGDALYLRYADILDAQGRIGEAEEWRQFTRSLRSGTLYNLGPQDTLRLRDAARLMTFALALSLLAAMLTLTARAWPAQTADLQALGGRWRSWRRPLDRLRLGALSYAPFSERLLLLTLCAAMFVSLGGWQWANQTGRALQTPALNTGTYGGGWGSTQLGRAGLDTLGQRPTPATYLLAGLTAQLDGNVSEARTLYTRAGQDACALNNLGVIAQSRDDTAQARRLYQQALSLQPDLNAAAYNLGRNPVTPETAFQRSYRPGQPRLCYPDRRTLAQAVGNDLTTVLRQSVTDPLGFLTGRHAPGRLNWAMLATLVLLAVLTLLLLIPRADQNRRQGRPVLFRVLATLLPGTGLLGNAWGGVLLVAWAAVVVALVSQGRVLNMLALPTLPAPLARNSLWLALAALYALNLLVTVLNEIAYARRQRLARSEA